MFASIICTSFQYAINPLEQQKVLNEIDEVLKRYNGKLCYEALQEMPYLEASLYGKWHLFINTHKHNLIWFNSLSSYENFTLFLWMCHIFLPTVTLSISTIETLRLYPPMLALLKHCTKSFELPPQRKGGRPFQVPEGMVFVVPVKAVH